LILGVRKEVEKRKEVENKINNQSQNIIQQEGKQID
jgi:hypothetical protein